MIMTNGKKKASRFKTVEQRVFYLPIPLSNEMEKYSLKHDMTFSKIACEGIALRITKHDNLYNARFNQGLKDAMLIVSRTKGAQMMFPSGLSYAQCVCDEIQKFRKDVEEKIPDEQS